MTLLQVIHDHCILVGELEELKESHDDISTKL